MDHDVTTLRGRRATQRWNRLSVGDIFERMCWSYPDKEAFVGWQGAFGTPEFERVTFREADGYANRIANALIEAGLQSGDRVMLCCDNSVEALLTMFGVAKAGMVVVPVNPNLAPDVLSWMVGHVEPRFVVADAMAWPRVGSALVSMALTAGAIIPLEGEVPDGIPTFAEWIATSPDTEPDVEIHADDVWSLVFTSGTTAMPKASMTTHLATTIASYDWALSYTRGLRFEQDIRMCTFLPIIHHITHNESLIPALVAGGTAIIGRRPDDRALAAAVTREKATSIWVGSPVFLERLVRIAQSDRDTYDLGSLTSMMFAWNTIGAKLHDELKELCAPGFTLFEVLGQTESVIASRFWLDQWPDKVAAGGRNYVGKPTPLSSTTVVDASGNTLRDQPGVQGEVVYRSPAITTGYYRNPEATETAFRHGWFHSGDCCEYDEDGLLVMVDRFKDIVKSGGENVSSLRVESVLIQHPDVESVAVIGVPDQRWGEMVSAVVVVREGSDPTAEEIIEFGRGQLAGFETPKRVFKVDEMPTTIGGKILKHRLRDRFERP